MSRKSKILILVCSVAAALIAMAIPRVFPKRSAKLSACKLNLRLIDIHKDHWANDEGKTSNDTPTWDDLRSYFGGWETNGMNWANGRPVCRGGGTYTIGRIGELPKCSIGGYDHSISEGARFP